MEFTRRSTPSEPDVGGRREPLPASDRSGREGSPPLSNRGVDGNGYQTEDELHPDKVFRSRFDFLTVSMSSATAESILDQTEHLRPGGRVQGFAQSEERMCFGGTLWVRSEPVTASRQWGTDYVSIELPGSQADAMLDRIPMDGTRATRIDLAHDWECSEDLKPEHVRDAWRPHWEPKGIKSGISGEDEINTVYLGSRSSDKRVRIYRKDLQDSMWRDYPLIRVETVVRRDVAAAVWKLSTRPAMAAAMNHALQTLTGHDMGDCAPPPPVPTLADTDLGQRVFEFVKQNGRLLVTLDRLGVDLRRLASLTEGQFSLRTEERLRADLIQNAAVNPDDLLDHVAMLFRS